MEKNPFSIYDFVGYLIPGAFLLYMGYVFLNYQPGLEIENLPYGYLSSIYNFIINPTIELTLAGVAICLILSYLTGFLIGYISSITIEEYAKNVYGFPSKFLLGPNKNRQIFEPFKSLWKATKIFGRQLNDCKEITLSIARIKSYRKAKSKILYKKLGQSVHSFWGVELQLSRIFFRLFLLLILAPIVICDFILGFVFRLNKFFTRGLDSTLVSIIKDKIHKFSCQLGNPFDSNHDYHRIVYHYIYERMSRHAGKTDNYVALYGLMRSMALIFNVLCYLIAIKIFILGTDENTLFASWWFIVIAGLLAYLFFMGFMKFYRRFTLESFMSLVVCDISVSETAKSKDSGNNYSIPSPW